MKRRIFAGLLSLAMIFTLIPTAWADGEGGTPAAKAAEVNGTQYETLQAAADAAQDGDTVTLLANTTEDVTIAKSITLDLGGKTLTNTNAGKATISVTGGTVTVKNGSVVGGTSYYNIEVTKNSGANLTLESVTATAGNTGSSMLDNWGTLTIKSGTYTGGLNVVKSEEGSTLNISGGKFTLAYATSGYTGVIFTYGTTTITGGEFIQDLTTTGRWNHPQVILAGVEAGYPSSVKVSDGTFTNKLSSESIFRGVGKATSDNFEVSGGTFNKSVSDSFFKDGYFAQKSGGAYTAAGPYAAKIGSIGYTTLAEAVTAAKNNAVITLLQDISSDRINLEDKSFTVELNGHTLTSTAAYGVMFCAKNGHKITVKGDKNSKLVGTLMVTNGTDGHIEIKGGTYENSQYCPIYINGAVSTENSTLSVKSATITALNSGSGQDMGCGVYLAGYCTSTFKDTTIIAPVTGIEIRAGKLTLTNCNVTGGNGTVTADANGNGTTVTNAALAISQHTTKKPIDVTVTGGTYTATAAIYQTDVQATGSADVKTAVASGKFNGTVSAETDGTVAIKGGTFTSAVPENCCAEGFVPVTNNNGTYGVTERKPVEVWTGYNGSKVGSYATVGDAAKNLGENKMILFTADYTLDEDFTIPADVYFEVDAGATLTIAEGKTLTVAADAKRLNIRENAKVVNNGTILVCGAPKTSHGYVMIPDGGELAGNALSVPEGKILSKNGNSYYAGEALFEITYTDGSTKLTSETTDVNSSTVQVKLLKDVTVGGWTLSQAADGFVLDLGGHTLNGTTASSYYVLYAGVSMTIRNGTIKYNGTADKGAICAYGGETLTIESDVTIDGGSGVGIMMQNSAPTVVLNGTVTTTGGYGFASNGSANADGNPDTCNIIVNDGARIKAPNGIAIYHPTLGTVTINGGEISGHTGIEMCAGKLIVNNGTITSAGANWDATGSQNAIMDGAAISIINRDYPGGTPTAEITGGTFTATGDGAKAVKAYDYTGDAVADWAGAGNSVNISGGTFSTEIPAEYCASGYVPKNNGNGTYGVIKSGSDLPGYPGGVPFNPTYPVTTPGKSEHGTVTVIPASAARGTTVTVITAPDKGYVLETLTVTDSTGNVLMLTDRGAGSFTFVMPAGHVEVRATFAEDNSVLNFFYDVPNDAYFYEAVKWAVGKGITTGVGGNLFAPEDPCSRAQIVTFLWRAAGSPEPRGTTAGMSDVVLGSYYEKAVAWAIENGITTGTGEGKFSPEDPCTRAQAVTFLARALNAKAAGTAAFSDVPADSYFAEAVAWALQNGVTTGIGGGLFGPDDDCTRAQIVTFLYRAYNK